jgi:hypothetical protein
MLGVSFESRADGVIRVWEHGYHSCSLDPSHGALHIS